jgi:hypothetical protein
LAITFFLDKKKDAPVAIPIGVQAFFLSFEKGSKNATEKIIRNAAGFWNFSPIKNTIREFQYKFIFN